MTLLSLDQIIGKDDRAHKDVDVPEWGGTVRLQTMSSADRDAYEMEAYRANKDGKASAFENVRARLVSLCWVDEKGELVCSRKDVAALGKKSAKVLNRLWDICRDLNGLSQADAEELEKNS